MLFIVVLALLIFGPKRLPEVGRTIGKGMAQFRKATTDLKRTIESEIALEEDPGRRPPAPQRSLRSERHPEPASHPGPLVTAAVPEPQAPGPASDRPEEALSAVATGPGKGPDSGPDKDQPV